MKGLIGTALAAVSLLMPYLANAATQYEAESAVRSGGANINTNHPGYTGTGFVDGYFNSSTAQTLFNVSVVAAGNATVTTRYSAGNGSSTNTGLYVNGVKIKNITFPGTGNWDAWGTQTETVNLKAGSNTIAYKAETSSSSSINLDNIVVQGAAATFNLWVWAGTGGTISAPATSPISVAQGAATTLTAAPLAGYNFLNWTLVNPAGTLGNASAASTTVTLNSGNDTVIANFAPKTYQLTFAAGIGGAVTSPVSSPTTVTHGVAIPISATPSSGNTFVNWTVTAGTATIANVNSASTTLTLTNGNASIQANFASGPVSYILGITNDGHGTTTPSGNFTVNGGAATSIAAQPAAGYQFQNWTITSGSASFASSTSASTTVSVTTNATIRANFTALPVANGSAVAYAEIASPVNVTTANTIVLALPFTAPSAGYITVVATGLYGTNTSFTQEQRGLESQITLNSVSGPSLSGFFDKPTQNGTAHSVSETAGFAVAAGANTVRLIVSPRSTLTTTVYRFAKCRITVTFSQQKM